MSLGGAKACLTIALRYAATRLTGLTPDMFLIYLCVCFSVLVTVSEYLESTVFKHSVCCEHSKQSESVLREHTCLGG